MNDSHNEWHNPKDTALSGLQPKFILTTWAIAALITTVVFITAVLIIGQFVSESGASSGYLFIASAFSTFLVFFMVVRSRLPRMEGGRFVNAAAIALLHVLVLGVFIVIDLILHATAGQDLSDLLPGGAFSELSKGFFILERSAAVSIPASILAAAIIPEKGAVPKGTQTAPVDAEHSL